MAQDYPSGTGAEIRTVRGDHSMGLGVDEEMDRSLRRGESFWSAKLKEIDIPVIRQRIGNGESFGKVAADYNVDKKSIWKAAKGFSWKHVR